MTVGNGQTAGVANGASSIQMVVDNLSGQTSQVDPFSITQTARRAPGLFSITPVQPSAFAQYVGSLFNSLNSEISDLESQVSSVTSGLGDLPLIGPNIASALNLNSLITPLTSKVQDLENQIRGRSRRSHLWPAVQLQKDIDNLLANDGLVPSGVTQAADIWYQQSGGQASELTASSSIDLSKISQLEIDLTVGQTATSTIPLGADLASPASA